MSKKHKSKKNLQKRLSIIIETYAGQKGKANKKKLSDFIEHKISEILSYGNTLRTKKKVVVLQPSPALAEELHKYTNNSPEPKNATAIL